MISLASRLSTVVLLGAVTIVQANGRAAFQVNASQASLPAGSRGLQLVVEVDKTTYLSGEAPSFTITLRNPGKENLLLNGGQLLGNGAEIWSAITCELSVSDGRRLPVSLTWGVPAVAGRIYFLGLPLRAGSTHTISVTPRDYYVGKGEHLGAGTYGLGCTYAGTQSSHRDAAQLPPCWEGVLMSNTARIEVRKATRSRS